MNTRPFEEMQAGLVFNDPTQVHEYADDTPGLTPREQLRVHRFGDQWATAVRFDICDRVDAATAEQRRAESNVQTRLADAREHIAEIADAVAHDRMDPDDGFKELGGLRREIRECQALLHSIERVVARINEMADKPIEDYLAALRDRFPAITGIGTATLTHGYLRGREEPPFVSRVRRERG